MMSSAPQSAYELQWLPGRVSFTAINGHTFPATVGNTVSSRIVNDPARIPTPGN